MNETVTSAPEPLPVTSQRERQDLVTGRRGAQARRLAVLVLVAAGLAVLSTPQITRPGDRHQLGEFTTQSIRAPYDVSVVDEEATQQQRAAAAEASPIVCVVDARVRESVESRFTQAWAPLEALLTPADGEGPNERGARAGIAARQRIDEAFAEAQRRLGMDIPAGVRASLRDRAAFDGLVGGFRTLVSEAYRAPLVEDATELDRLRTEGAPVNRPARVALVDRVTGRELQAVEAGQVSDVPTARAALQLRAGELVTDLPASTVDWLGGIASAWLVPNAALDEAATRERRRVAADAILPVSVSFRRNELVIGEGQPVTRQALLVLDALRRQRLDRDTWRHLAGRIGVILSLLVAALWTTRRDGWPAMGTGHFPYLVTSLVATAVFFRLWLEVVGGLAARYPGLPEAALIVCFPAAGSVMYARMLLPSYAATIYLGVQSLCLGLLWQADLLYVVYLLVSGGIAGLLARSCSRRQCVVRAGLVAGLAVGPLAACLTLLTDARGTLLLWTTAGAMLGGALSGIAVLAIGPVFEWLFGHLTRIRLVELMNYQHPLLRRITEVTPGTFQHSVTVGLLADAAATAIDADALLARVGALYHDAGKTDHPDHFTENQQGTNPHDRLSPRDSAQAIIGHVEAGVRLVREFGLGERIADFVREHHGTSTVRSFLAKAEQAAQPVDPGDFRYPGPRPRSRETAILMIADQVEATARAMDAVSEEALRTMVRSTIERIEGERQFDECPLTLQEVATIGDTLTQVLSSVHHRRVKYPKAASA